MDIDSRSHPSRRRQRISGPGELLQAVPYLLGFHPAASLVFVGLDGTKLIVTARLDLADVESGAVAHTIEAIVRGGGTSIIAVVYDDDAPGDSIDGLRWRDLVPLIEEDADSIACDLLDVLLVAEGRWWSLMCASGGCCPSEGQPLPSATSAFAAASAYEGVVALPSRAALEAVLDPVPDEQRQPLERAIERAEHAAVRTTVDGHAGRYERSVKRALFAAARASDDIGWTAVSDAEVARFVAALAVTPIRDSVWTAIDDGRLDGRPLWRDLARRAPAPYDAPPLFLFGWASWRAGDGALAGIAAERAVTSDPRYSAADMLLAALSAGINPKQMPKLRLPRSA